jgi:hypothetical protein
MVKRETEAQDNRQEINNPEFPSMLFPELPPDLNMMSTEFPAVLEVISIRKDYYESTICEPYQIHV